MLEQEKLELIAQYLSLEPKAKVYIEQLKNELLDSGAKTQDVVLGNGVHMVLNFKKGYTSKIFNKNQFIEENGEEAYEKYKTQERVVKDTVSMTVVYDDNDTEGGEQ